MKCLVSIGYKDVFEDYESINFQELTKDIPTKNSLQIIGYFMAQLHTVEREHEMQIDFLKMWLGRFPYSIHKPIAEFISRVESNQNSNFIFLDNVSLLILTEKIIENENKLEQTANLSQEAELNLFKAYLYCSQLWSDRQYKELEKKTIENETDLIKILLPVQLPYQEILELKDFRLQFIKAIYFFKFC